MEIFDTFSFRQRLAEGRMPDVVVYDEFPRTLRVQVIDIWRRAIGPCQDGFANPKGWAQIHHIVARELGEFSRGEFSLGEGRTLARRCENFLLRAGSVDNALDLVDVSFHYVDRVARQFRDYERRQRGIRTTASDAIKELNERFRRAGLGYQFEEGMIFRVDSELIHAEVVKPALRYLNEPGFEGPREEFLKAHAHYRAGEIKAAITDANNAFESTLRAVCDQRGWSHERGARISDLLKILRENSLLPGYLDKSFGQLAATLHSGLPQVRNNESAHGDGPTPRKTPEYVAGYALHLAAANILFIVEAHKAMP